MGDIAGSSQTCKTDTLANVDMFMKVFGQDRNFGDYADTDKFEWLMDLRMNLIKEEVEELVSAIYKIMEVNKLRSELKDIADENTKKVLDKRFIDLMTEVYDAGIDIQYVLDGLFIAFGLPKEKGFKEVQLSNMSKLDNGKVIYNDAGKVMKGPNYVKPDLKSIIKELLIEKGGFGMA